MSQYVLIVDSDQGIEEKLKTHYPDYFRIDAKIWSFRSEAVSKVISDNLFPPDAEGKRSRHIILRVGAWWGFHNRSLWEWLDKKGD